MFLYCVNSGSIVVIQRHNLWDKKYFFKDQIMYLNIINNSANSATH